jgi:hypothetical protein
MHIYSISSRNGSVANPYLWSEVGGQHHHAVCSHVPARPRFADAPGLDRNNWACGGQGQGCLGPTGAPPGAKGGPGGLLNGARGRRGGGEDFYTAPRTCRGGTGCHGLSWDLVFRALPGATGGGSDAPASISTNVLLQGNEVVSLRISRLTCSLRHTCQHIHRHRSAATRATTGQVQLTHSSMVLPLPFKWPSIEDRGYPNAVAPLLLTYLLPGIVPGGQ